MIIFSLFISFTYASRIIGVKETFRCTLYDDFSTGELDLTKWKEVPGSDLNELFLDEHYVDHGQYHTAQYLLEDRGVSLELLKYTFLPGERVEFDLNYQGGSGNRISYVDIDESTKWFGLVGYWNGEQLGGNELGTYHFAVKFTEFGADVFITRPNGDFLQIYQFPQTPGAQHTFGFGTRSGGGTVHMDYDNVRICKF